jgi:hypothetical protein
VLRPTYSGVVSTLALVFALGGGAYAATALPANSVGPRQLKNGAVEAAKIKPGAVGGKALAANAIDGSKVKNGSLGRADIDIATLGTVPSAATAGFATTAGSATSATSATTAGSATSATTATTAASATHADHADAAAALDGVSYKSAAGEATGALTSATATCSAGTRVVGGGVRLSDPVAGNVADDYPEGTTGWTGRVASGGPTVTYTVYAICVPATATQ